MLAVQGGVLNLPIVAVERGACILPLEHCLAAEEGSLG